VITSAPEVLTAAEAVAKIEEDFAGAKEHWGEFKRWVFVWSAVDSGLPPAVVAKLKALREDDANAEIVIDDWGHENLWDLVKELTPQQRAELLGSVPVPAQTTAAEIRTVLNWLIDSGLDPVEPAEDFEHTALADKIELNQLSDRVSALIARSIPVAADVERYVSNSYDGDFSAKVASIYQRLEILESDPDKIFVALVDGVASGPYRHKRSGGAPSGSSPTTSSCATSSRSDDPSDPSHHHQCVAHRDRCADLGEPGYRFALDQRRVGRPPRRERSSYVRSLLSGRDIPLRTWGRGPRRRPAPAVELMILRVAANHQSLKTLKPESQFNVVLAERTLEGTDRDSTNGSGKTLLLEIVHFAFGADAQRSPVMDPHLSGWRFSVDFALGEQQYQAMRSVDEPARVYVTGTFQDWPHAPRRDEETGALSYSVQDWTDVLGARVYGLPLAEDTSKFRPTFRTIFSYAARRGFRSYGNPFSIIPQQPAWQRHVSNAYLLGLDWSIYQRAQQLEDREDSLKKASKATTSVLTSGALGEFEGIGDLEARRINLEREVRIVEEQLQTFRVDPQYHEHEKRASDITTSIHDLVAETVTDRETLAFYLRSLDEEQAAQPHDITQMYQEAGVHFPEQVARQLSDARAFHEQLVANRRAFLAAEMDRLEERIRDLEVRVLALTAQRARELSFLREHGALEDLTRLQILHKERVEDLGRIGGQIEQLRSYEERLATLRIEREQLKLEARRDFDQRRDAWRRVVELFGAFTDELYDTPGQLVGDIDRDGGLKLDYEIERGASQGFQQMVVFCYDLAVSTALAERQVGPGFLWHDSSVFDGVDPRQKAAALRLAERQSREAGFQYLISLNAGDVPWEDLGDFDLRAFERLALTDVGEGGLLGIRY